MKKSLLSLIVVLPMTFQGLAFAQENDWIEYSGSDIIVYDSPDKNYGIVIQDRNVGATMTGYGGKTTAATGSYGYHFQWGNNHGFETCYTLWCSSFPGGETTSKIPVDASDYGPNNPYSNSTFIKIYGDWSNPHNDNLWGGVGDDETNGYGLTSKTSLTNRQGPCPNGYHIPSAGELNELRILWYNNKYGTDFSIGDLGLFLRSYDTPIDKEFSKDLLVPYAGGRDYDGDSWVGAEISLYSSTPAFVEGYVGNAYSLNLYNDSSYHIHMAFEMPRTMAYPIRCFKNEKIIKNPDAISINFDANGGNSVTTGSVTVALGGTLDISIFSGTKDGWEFTGWHTNPWESVPMVDPVVRGPFTLYAIFEKGLTVTYLSGEEITSIGANSDSCIMNKEGIGCDVVAPSITTSRTGYSGIWSNGNVVVKPGDYITLTGDDTYTTDITPNTYKVKFNRNGGVGSMKDQTFTYDTPQKLTGNTFTKSGYIFSGWTYGETSYKDKQEVLNLTTANNKTLTFTAQWKVDPGYIVHGPFYTSNGKEFMIAVSTSDGTINTGVTLSENSGYTESELLEILGNDLEHTNAEIVDIEDLGGDVLFLESPAGTEFTTKGFCSTEGGCIYFETSGLKDVTDDFKNQAMDTENVQGPTRAISASDYIKYNEVGSGGFLVLVKSGDTDGYVYVPIKKYTVIRENSDGSNLKTDVNVKYGTIPSYDGIPEKPADSVYTYEFTGWNPEISAVTGDITYTAIYTQTPISIEYTITFVLGNGEPDILITGAYGTVINIPANPTREGYTFDGRDMDVPETMPAENKTIHAKWIEKENKPSGGSSWGGGGGRAPTKPTNTENNQLLESGNKIEVEISDGDPQEILSNGYTRELNDAYKFAYKYGITTMTSIEQADMWGSLSRIAMAKMLSQYAINILGLKPDTTRISNFSDVSKEIDLEYNSGVTLAYQLGIMGINMPDSRFRPYDYVPRAEFVTALSRMLYRTSDGEYAGTPKYYTNHMNLLGTLGIVANKSPELQEIRGYVMLMLMRSAMIDNTGSDSAGLDELNNNLTKEKVDNYFTEAYKVGKIYYKIGDLQRLLKSLGYYNGEINNTYNRSTLNAVYDFQVAMGILDINDTENPARGYIGPETRDILNQKWAEYQLSQ